MSNRTRTVFIILFIVFVSNIETLSAATIIADDGTAYLRQFSTSQGIGYDFTVGQTPLTVNALGIWDDAAVDVGYPVGSGNDGSTGGVPDGIAGTVTVQLWQHTSSTTGVKLAEVTIAGTEGFLDGEFRYVELPEPVVLIANTTYQITCYTSSTTNLFHQFQRMDSTSDVQVSSYINNYVARFTAERGTFLEKWAANNPAVAAERVYVGPNLLFSMSGNPVVTNPTPSDQANELNPQMIFSWGAVYATSPTFEILIATDESFNNIIVSHNTGSAQSYTPASDLLNYETTYYWRIDITDDNTVYPNNIWSFTTGGKAYDPSPVDMSILGLGQFTLNWQGYDWIDSYNVSFGLPGEMISIWNYSATEITLDDIADAMGLSMLTSGTYQWKVDSLNSNGVLLVDGDVWTVEIPEEFGMLLIDDFEHYKTTSNLRGSWNDGTVNGTGSVISEELMGKMKLVYDNSTSPMRSEVTRQFGTPQDWSISDQAVFSLTVLGDTTNTPNVIYVIVSDSTSSKKIMLYSPDVLTTDSWRECFFRMNDLVDEGIGLTNITSLTIGIGDGQTAGSGTVHIDDIQLYMSKCVSKFSSLGDINSDCKVDVLDLHFLAESWLLRDYEVFPVQPEDSHLVAHYLFNETFADVVSDSAGSNDAQVIADDPDVLWNAVGYDQGCIAIADDIAVAIPESIWAGISGSMTISFWINGQAADYPDSVNQLFVKYPSDVSNEYTWSSAIWDIDRADSYGGSWNHVALSVDTATGLVRLFHNGRIVSETMDQDVMASTGIQMDTSILSAGIIDGLGASILLDEFRVYDYALSPEEIVWLSAGISGHVTQSISPVFTEADLNEDGTVSLPDFAEVASFWMNEI